MEKKVSQDEPRGNTKTRGTNTNQLYRWCFTLKAEDVSVSQMSQLLHEFAKEFYFQKELGENTGYEHWQGCISLKQKHRFKEVQNIMPGGCHLEACKNWFKAKQYCQKEKTRIEGPYNHNSVIVDLDITKDNMYDWQKDVINIITKKPDKRKIYWFWEEIGNIGKSELCKYIYINYKCAFFTNAKTADIAYAYNGEPIVIFDLPRTTEDYFNFNAIEQLKNGMLFSSKYESGAKVFNRPHIIVFANWEPTNASLSKDRLIVRRL